jgi:5-formyltetrahydrofolate cyclo-ligase
MDKLSTREIITSKCKCLTPTYRINAEQHIFKNALPLLEVAQKIAIYKAYAWEASLGPLIKFSLSHDKELYQPIAYKHKKDMLFKPYTPEVAPIFTEKENTKQHNNSLQWYNLDLIFLPLVAIDNAGYRLGKGGGYYDATLSKIKECSHPPILCGVGYACQIVEDICADTWDIKLNYFVSDNKLIKF